MLLRVRGGGIQADNMAIKGTKWSWGSEEEEGRLQKAGES